MNKQELIKHIEDLPYKEGPVADTITINRKELLKLIKQLDEPQPLKLKDIISRMRQLFPLSRSEWIDEILHEFGGDYGSMKYRDGYEQGKLDGAWVGNQLKDADKIRQELNKPVVKQFVAVWIEECKAKGKNLLRALLYTPEKVNSWVDDPDNQEIFALAWILGYEVEEEKRYYIRLKGVDENYNYLNYIKHLNAWVLAEIKTDKKFRTTHTKKELEEANFGWVFDCPGIEIEEVE